MERHDLSSPNKLPWGYNWPGAMTAKPRAVLGDNPRLCQGLVCRR